MDFTAFTDEFCKLAAHPVSEEEARKALHKLQVMEEQRDLGAVGRAAGVGAALMPVAGMAGRTVSGIQRFLKPNSSVNFKRPGSVLKAIDWKGLGRQATADAMMGSIGGGVLPLTREGVERRAQKAKLENYIEQGQGNRAGSSFRRQIQANTGL